MADSVSALVTALVEVEQGVLRELVRLAELNADNALDQSEFQATALTMRRQLRAHGEQVSVLETLANGQERPAQREEAQQHARRHRAEGLALSDSLRDLGLKVQAGTVQREATERAALLLAGAADGGEEGGDGRTRLQQRAAVQAAREATASLRRTRALMASELQRSDSTMQQLDAQGKVRLHVFRKLAGGIIWGEAKLAGEIISGEAPVGALALFRHGRGETPA